MCVVVPFFMGRTSALLLQYLHCEPLPESPCAIILICIVQQLLGLVWRLLFVRSRMPPVITDVDGTREYYRYFPG